MNAKITQIDSTSWKEKQDSEPAAKVFNEEKVLSRNQQITEIRHIRDGVTRQQAPHTSRSLKK